MNAPMILAALVSVMLHAGAAVTPQRLVFLGDSLTAGYQLPKERAYPALLQERIRAANLPWITVNAGVSGDTTAGALRRAGSLFREPIGLLVVWIGANDGLRGQSVDAMQKNIEAILTTAKSHTVPTMLVQMHVPPNYGPDYSSRFESVFPQLARKYGVPLIPFPLDQVAGEAELNLADGVHPNAKGHALIAEVFWKALEPKLR
jgi:acyl-CoA thioesterase-1